MSRRIAATLLVFMITWPAGAQAQLSPPVRRASTRVHAVLKLQRRINLNTATSRDLRKLPQVGELLAQRIISARPYHAVDELKRVKGMTPARIEALKPLVAL